MSRPVASDAAVWANSSAANTQKTVALDSAAGADDRLLVIVRNPSAVTQLAGEVQISYDDAGTVRWAKLSSFTVAANNGDGEAFVISAGAIPGRLRVSLRNSTVLGVADGFTAQVRAYQLDED